MSTDPMEDTQPIDMHKKANEEARALGFLFSGGGLFPATTYTCPVCGALVVPENALFHHNWHVDVAGPPARSSA